MSQDNNKSPLPIKREDLDLEKFILTDNTIILLNSKLNLLRYFDQITDLSLLLLVDRDFAINYSEVVVGALQDLYIDWEIKLLDNHHVRFKLK